MKIIIVNSYFSLVGGSDKIAYETYKVLKENNHDVYFWAMDRKPYFEADYEYIKYFTPCYYGLKDYINNPLKYYYNYSALRDFKKFVYFIKPDLIHYHNISWLSSAIYRVDKHIPKVSTVHFAQCCPVGTLMYKNKQYYKNMLCKNGNYLPCIINNCAKTNFEESIRKTILSYFELHNFKYIDEFITPSEALTRKMIDTKIGINESNIITIPNFLNQQELAQRPNYKNQRYFLFIGRLSKEKGVHSLLKAMKDLPKEIKLKIVGTGPEEDILKKYKVENNLDNVEFWGFLQGEAKKNAFQNCIATILPSNWFEIFGMTNIESFINGKPVIASNIGGIPEIVEDNMNGLLFEPGNVEQLKECILKYWNNPDLVVEHGKNGYAKVTDIYTYKKYYQMLIKCYEQVIEDKSKKAYGRIL